MLGSSTPLPRWPGRDSLGAQAAKSHGPNECLAFSRTGVPWVARPQTSVVSP